MRRSDRCAGCSRDPRGCSSIRCSGSLRVSAGRESSRWLSNVRNAPHGVILEASESPCDVHEEEPKNGEMSKQRAESLEFRKTSSLGPEGLALDEGRIEQPGHIVLPAVERVDHEEEDAGEEALRRFASPAGRDHGRVHDLGGRLASSRLLLGKEAVGSESVVRRIGEGGADQHGRHEEPAGD